MEDNDGDIVTLMAERKIAEAREAGLFDNLDGEGKPLPEDDLANLPREARLAARVLRSAGFAPEGPAAGNGFAVSPETPDGAGRHLRDRVRDMDRLAMALTFSGGGKGARGTRASRGSGNAGGASERPGDPADPGARGEKLLESSYLGKILDRLFGMKKG
ncbi:MAG: DUF1992 domain-containing protein [Deltaproteobacteria bacterium]|jgi:hypothetical protein|nr:DUF1992 domain-containing protein [Deltaproteobacteria bacterium]